MAMPVVSEMPLTSQSPARRSGRAGPSPPPGAKVEYRERERRQPSRGASGTDGSVIKTEPQAQSRVKQEQLDDSVVGRVKQEPLDDPVAEDDLRAQWEADLQVKEEEDDDDPGEEQYPEDDADDDEEEEEEEEEGDDVAEAQSGRDDYGSAEEDAD